MKRVLTGIYGAASGADLARLRRLGEAAPDGSVEFRDERLAAWVSGGNAARVEAPVICAVDGSIFDLEDLAGELGLPSGLPSEAILAAAYARLGDALLARLRGEFALFLWDRRSRRGTLARDQMGTRSLFFHAGGSRLVFGSEVRDVLGALAATPGPAEEALLHFLAGNALPPGSTLFDGVEQLRPGHSLALEGGRWQVERYWAPVHRSAPAAGRRELAGRLRGAIETAVERRLGADRRGAVVMSGGLDSTALAAVAQRHARGRLRAYAAVFPDRPALDESRWIDATAAELDLPTTRTQPRAAGLLDNALDHISTWRLPPSGFGFWLPELYRRAARDGAELMLTGDGGDEMFEARPYLIADRLRSGRLLSAARVARALPGMGDYPPWRPVLRALARYGLLGALPPLTDRLGGGGAPHRWWLSAESNRLLRGQWDPLGWRRIDGPRWWADASDRLMRRVQGMGLLDHVRREAERTGLEPALPFFDLDLVELALAVPPELGLHPYLRKPMLRASMEGLLPEAVRLRLSKTVFDELTIAAVSGAEMARIAGLLDDPGAEVVRYLDRTQLRRLLATPARDDREAARDAARALWRLAAVECWFRSLGDLGPVSRLLESAASPGAQPGPFFEP